MNKILKFNTEGKIILLNEKDKYTEEDEKISFYPFDFEKQMFVYESLDGKMYLLGINANTNSLSFEGELIKPIEDPYNICKEALVTHMEQTNTHLTDISGKLRINLRVIDVIKDFVSKTDEEHIVITITRKDDGIVVTKIKSNSNLAKAVLKLNNKNIPFLKRINNYIEKRIGYLIFCIMLYACGLGILVYSIYNK